MSILYAPSHIDSDASFRWSAPAVMGSESRDQLEAEWAVVAAVAAILGIAIAVVAYICAVCQARSFNACMNAVKNYWTKGC